MVSCLGTQKFFGVNMLTNSSARTPVISTVYSPVSTTTNHYHFSITSGSYQFQRTGNLSWTGKLKKGAGVAQVNSQKETRRPTLKQHLQGPLPPSPSPSLPPSRSTCPSSYSDLTLGRHAVPAGCSHQCPSWPGFRLSKDSSSHSAPATTEAAFT